MPRRYQNSRYGGYTRPAGQNTGVYRRPSTFRGYRRRGLTRSGVKRVVRSMAEHKYWDKTDTGAGTSFNTNGPVLLTGIPQGTTDSTRVGDKLQITSMQFTFDLFTVSHAACGVAARIIVFQWYDDGTPTAASILQDVTNPLISPFDHDLKVKRRIVMDKTIGPINDIVTVDYQSFDSGMVLQNNHIIRKFYVDLTKKRAKQTVLHFQAASTVAEGHYYLMAFIAEVRSGLAYSPVTCLQYWSRINYIDL